MQGLRLMSPTKGTTTWTVFSSAAESFRKALNFHHDAFTIIHSAKNLNDWKISLFNRDVLNKNDLSFKETWFNFFSGEKIN